MIHIDINPTKPSDWVLAVETEGVFAKNGKTGESYKLAPPDPSPSGGPIGFMPALEYRAVVLAGGGVASDADTLNALFAEGWHLSTIISSQMLIFMRSKS